VNLTMDGMRFTGNTASTAGGAYAPLYSHRRHDGSAELRDQRRTPRPAPRATGWGGGLAVYSATVTVTNTTIAGNTVAVMCPAVGGGVWAGMDSNVTITSSTIAGNTVTSPSPLRGR
jgi:hypothetical protein